MAVVALKSDLYPATPSATPDPARANGRSHVVRGSVSNGATDSANSTFLLASLPADCVLDEQTSFKVDGWGFATIRIGTRTDNDALVDVLRSAGTYVTPVAVGDAKHGLPLWQVLGLAAAPENNVIDLYAHGIAGATGAGSMKFKIVYQHHS